MDNNNYLVHHGILGQKWGIRRYQNYDGTLTSAGRKRYDKLVEKDRDLHNQLEKSGTNIPNNNKIRGDINRNNNRLKEITGLAINTEDQVKSAKESIEYWSKWVKDSTDALDKANYDASFAKTTDEIINAYGNKGDAEADLELGEYMIKEINKSIEKYADFKIKNGYAVSPKSDEQVIDDYNKRGGKLYTTNQFKTALESTKKELSEYRKKPLKDRDLELEDLIEMEIKDLQEGLEMAKKNGGHI